VKPISETGSAKNSPEEDRVVCRDFTVNPFCFAC